MGVNTRMIDNYKFISDFLLCLIRIKILVVVNEDLSFNEDKNTEKKLIYSVAKYALLY